MAPRVRLREPGAEYESLRQDMLDLGDEPFMGKLPDILQAQVVVQLRRTEKLLWAGNPIIRTQTLLLLFLVWSILLVVPVLILVEMVEDTGGWWALAWAVVSVFIFVPRVSRTSRVVFALTSRRAFRSVRTMYCSIETQSLDYAQVRRVAVRVHPDGTGEVRLFKVNDIYDSECVVIDNIKGLRDACRVLADVLPPALSAEAGLGEVLEEYEPDGPANSDRPQ